MTEQEAIELAETPEKIIDALQCNSVIGFLNAHITDLSMDAWEKELAASQFHVALLNQENKTVALKEAEYKISDPYIKWKEAQHLLRKYRAYRRSLRDKEESLRNTSKFIRNNYGSYPRAIE